MAAKLLSDDELFAAPGGGVPEPKNLLSDSELFLTDEQLFGAPTADAPRAYEAETEQLMDGYSRAYSGEPASTDDPRAGYAGSYGVTRPEGMENPIPDQGPIAPKMSDLGKRVVTGAVDMGADMVKSAGLVSQQIADSRPKGDQQSADFYRQQVKGIEAALSSGAIPPDRVETAKRSLEIAREQLALREARVMKAESGQILGTKAGQEPESTPAYQIGQSVSDWADETFPTDKSMDDDYSSKLASGLGSMLAFLAGGGVGATLRAPAFFTTALMGSSAQATSGFDDARRNGADLDTAYASMWWNAGVGLSEAVPISRALDRLNDATGGEVTRIIKQGFKGGIEELIQEVFQTVSSKAIAGDYIGLGYNPKADDPTWDYAVEGAEAGSIGFILGSTLSTLTSFIGSRRAAGQRNAAETAQNEAEAAQDQAIGNDGALAGLDPNQARSGNLVIDPPKRMAPLTEADAASPLADSLISRGNAILNDVRAGRPLDITPNTATEPPQDAPTGDIGAIGEGLGQNVNNADQGAPQGQQQAAPPPLEPIYNFNDEGNATSQLGWYDPATNTQYSIEEGNRINAERSAAPAAPAAAPSPAPLNASMSGSGSGLLGNAPIDAGQQSQSAPAPAAPTQATTAPSGDLQMLDPETIATDPEKFQFKGGGDAQGVTDTLKGTKDWNPDYAGVAIVWERADGQRFIVDGHQRLGFAMRAKQAGQEGVQIRARVLREVDGITPEKAMFEGALKNIAEGGESTKPLDVARVLRNASDRDFAIQEAQKFIPPRRRAYQDGVSLSNLGDEAWGMVVNEVVPANFAAIVGRSMDDAGQQVAALGYLAKNPPGNIDQARMIVDQIKAAGFSEGTQDSLFGSESLTGTLIAERAKVLDSAVRNLKSMKKLFKTAVEGGDILTAAGNVLDADANQQQLTDNERLGMALEKLAQRKGPVSDALSEAARALKAGDSVAKARDAFLAAVREVKDFNAGNGGNTGSVPQGGAGSGTSTDAVSDQEVDPDTPERDPNVSDMFGDPVTPEEDTNQGANPPEEQADSANAPNVEQTDQGEQQLIDGVAPVTDGDRLNAVKDKPLTGGNAPMDGGLFDVAGRGQSDLLSQPDPEPETVAGIATLAGVDGQNAASSQDAPTQIDIDYIVRNIKRGDAIPNPRLINEYTYYSILRPLGVGFPIEGKPVEEGDIWGNEGSTDRLLIANGPVSIHDQARLELVPLGYEAQVDALKQAYTAKKGTKPGRYELRDPKDQDTGRGSMITPSSKGSAFQLTTFDVNGFAGDMQFNTLDDALQNAISLGHVEPSPGWVSELMQLDSFQEGNKRTQEMERENAQPAAANAADPNPSDAQKEAGNYQMKHVRLHGLDISIETEKGNDRTSKPGDPNPWSVTMPADYGYIRGTTGADGDHVDVYLGPSGELGGIYIIDQIDLKTGKFDEHKIMLGFENDVLAVETYEKGFSDGKGADRMGTFNRFRTVEDFKEWLENGDQAKPYGTIPESKKKVAEPAAPELTIRDFSEKAIIVEGKTKENIDRIKSAIGRRPLWNKGAKGWIFRKADEAAVREALADLLGEASAAPAVNQPGEPDSRGSVQPTGPRVMVNKVGRDGKTDAERGGPIDKDVGQNSDGETIFEDGRGVRSVVANGVRSTETVATNPRGEISINTSRRDDRFKTPAEIRKQALDAGTPPIEDDRERQRRENVKKMEESSSDNNDVSPQGPVSDTPSAASRPSTFGANNKLVSIDRAAELRAKLKAKLKGQLNTGIDPEIISMGTELSVFYVEAGTRKFADYVRVMTEDMGAGAKPYLKMWYNSVRDFPGMVSGDMTPYSEVTDEAVEAALQEASDGLQGSIRYGDAGAGAGNIQVPSENGGDGRPSTEEVGGSTPAVRGTDAGRSEDGGRVSDASGAAGSGRNSVRNADRVSSGGRSSGTAGTRDANPVSQNYHIEPGALDEGRGWKQKARDNIAAIELMQKIESEARQATPSEQETLAQYVGWGGIKNAFPDAQGKFNDGFAEIGASLQKLLTKEEYATAERSIQYAHYTSETIVRAMWAGAGRLGFTGGKVFEPGMGVGNFAGMMPLPIATKTAYNGLEMDSVSARIAKLLYPKWGVRMGDFTASPLAKNTYDLAIGNPPFADITIQSDPEYKSNGFLLHDYFFAKSLDGVRPGGLLMFISSAGTMNKIDTKAREYMADRAELVGAIRLPGNAFSKNAGTEVTTDIVVLRKRLPDEAAGDRTWTETVPVTLPGPDGTPTMGRMSRYFHDNPDMVLGEQGFFDKLYKGRYGVRALPGVDIEAAITEAMNKLPVDAMKPWADTTERAEIDFSSTEKKSGTYYVGPDGALYQQIGGQGEKVKKRAKGVKGGITKDDDAKIRKLIPIRDALRDVYAADLASDVAAGDKARKQLNKTYDAFVAEFGAVNKVNLKYSRPIPSQQESARSFAREEARYNGQPFDEGTFDPREMIDDGATPTAVAKARKAAREAWEAEGKVWDEGTFDPDEMPDVVSEDRVNVKAFMRDPESYRLRSIEHHDDTTGVSKKGLVFRENVISKDREPEIKSAADALVYVLRQTGDTDINEIARYAGVSVDEALAELGDSLFENPANPGTYQTKGAYLAGNVRQKLRAAQAAAETSDRFQRNVVALEGAQPIPLTPRDIRVNLGMPWVPADLIADFGTAADGMGLESLNVSYDPVFAVWKVSGDTDSAAARSTWGIDERGARAPSLLLAALNRQTVKVTKKTTDGETYTDPVQTEAAQAKVKAIKERFSAWVWENQERAQGLADFYNETQNNLVVQEFDGSYLTTPGVASQWSWRPHQKRVMARIIQQGNTYMAHAVGAGKTSAMIGAGMEMRRLGLVRKPMYVVPNHMLAQFSKEFYEQYPTARIMVADEAAFHTDRRKQFISNAATDDLDAIIITHSSFGKIPVSDEFADGLVEKELSEYRALMADMEANKEDGDNRITKGQIQKQIERLEQKLKGRKNNKADQVFTFEEMGVDFLFVDEAHLFRKLDYATKMGQIKGIDGKGSDQSWDLYTKSKYLNEMNPGRSLVLASGTPVTNTMAELYTVSRYLQEGELEGRGISKFDAWAGAFGDVALSIEDDGAGGYKNVTRFAQFVNVADLSNMVRQVMDVVTSEELEQYVTRPQIKGGKRELHLVEKSTELEEYQETLADRMVKIAERKGPPEKGDDIILNVINDGRHAAIDMRLTPAVEDKMTWQSNMPSKLDIMIGRVHEIYVGSTRQAFHGVKPEGGYTDKPIDKGPATQMIFANLGLGDKRGFKVPDAIRAELRRRGVPDKEIAYIADYKTQAARQRLFNDMNEGKIRILIGSTAKMGTGVNAQKRLLAVHNLDPLWYPADDEQRNGRILRQGNMNPEIQIHDYGAKGTYDATMWSLMGTKARFIEGFFRGDPTLRDMEDLGEAGLYEQAKALSTSDPRLITLTEKKQELQKRNRMADAFERETYMAAQRITQAERSAVFEDKRAAAYAEAIAKRQDTTGDLFKGTVGGKEYTDRIEFGDAVLGTVALAVESKNRSGIKDRVIANLAGFDVVMDVTASNGKDPGRPYLGMVLTDDRIEDLSMSTSARGLTQAFESVPRALAAMKEKAEARAAESRKVVEQFRPVAERERQDTTELRALSDEVQALEEEITGAAEKARKDAEAAAASDAAEDSGDGPAGKFRKAPKTVEFDGWFGDSKVVDADGKPLVVYHGTRSDVEAFDQSFAKSATGDFEDSAIGFMFSNNPNAAGVFAVGVNRQGRRGANVMPVYMSLKNPLIVEFDGQKFTDFELFRRFEASLGTTARATTEGAGVQVQNALRDQGYDGVIVRNAKFGTATPAVTRDAGGPVGENDIFIALDPTQIKSATGNNGNYDPNDPRIRYRAPGQEIDAGAFGDGRPTLTEDGRKAAQAVEDLLRTIAPRSRVQVFDQIVDEQGTALGYGHYLDGVISIALNGADTLGTARHEAIHFLKDVGAIRPDQWLALRSAAIREDWVKKHDIRARYRREKLTEEQMIEEAIAEEYAMNPPIRDPKTAVDRAFEAMRKLFERIRIAMREALGYEPTAADVFSMIESGQIGRQDRVRQVTGSALADALLSQISRFKIDAWHGSPHKFDKFSTDAMGTGEGAQAYGWGLYFAGKREIAEYYRKAVSMADTRRTFLAALPEDADFSDVMAAAANGEFSAYQERVLNALEADDWLGFDYPSQAISAAYRDLDKYDASQELRDAINSSGALYEVEINAEVDHMLDWDKPLSEQSAYVRERVLNLILVKGPRGNMVPLQEVVDQWRDGGMDPSKMPEMKISGAQIYHQIADQNRSNPALRGSLSSGSARAASLALLEAGIPGNKYLDGSSRSAGEGSQNFVIFDGNAVDVRGKFQAQQAPPGNANQNSLGQPFGGAPGNPTPTPRRRGRGGPVQGQLGVMNLIDPDWSLFDSAREQLQDSFLRPKRVQETIAKQAGRAITLDENVYRAEEQYTGRVGARLDNLAAEHKEPLVNAITETLGKKTITIPDGKGGTQEAKGHEILEAYLYARHAPERNAKIASINPDFPDGGSGMTDADAATILSTIGTAGLTGNVAGLATAVDTMLDESLDTRVNYGLMTVQEATQWRQTYRNYTPLRGVEELTSEGAPARPRVGRGFNVRGPESQRALGRESRAQDILATIFTMADEAVVRGEKNMVFNRFHNLVSNHPDPDFWEINPVKMVYGINKLTGQVELRAANAMTAAQAENTVRGKVNGKEVRILVHDQGLADAMNKVGAAQLDGFLLQSLAKGTRWLSAMNTSMNPEFMITNAFRDIQTAGVMLQQYDMAGITKDTIKGWNLALTAVADGVGMKNASKATGIFQSPAEKARWAQMYKEFNEAGGRVAFWKIDDVADHQKSFDKAMRESDPNLFGKLIAGPAKFTWKSIENANIAVDNAVRLAAYKAARDRGMSISDAASLAKNLTVNFNRKGKQGPLINAAFMFFNAGMQGTTILATGLYNSKRIRRTAAGLVAAGFMAEMLNVMLSDEDDETGELAYDKIGGSKESADFIKSRSMVIVDPTGTLEGGYAAIPLPYGLNAFWDLGRNMAAYARGGQTEARTLGNVMTTTLTAFMPLGSIVPTLLVPAYELKNNENFMGYSIYPKASQFDASPAPLSAQPWRSTSETSAWIARNINDWTGGDTVVPGAVDLSPQVLDYLAAYGTGGAGRFYGGLAEWIGGAVASGAKGEPIELELRDVPFVRKVVKTKSPSRDRNDAYEAIGEIQMKVGQYRDYKKAGDTQKGQEFLAENRPLIQLGQAATTTKKAISDIRKARIALEKDGVEADDPRMVRLEETETRITKLLIARYRGAIKTMGRGDRPDWVDDARQFVR